MIVNRTKKDKNYTVIDNTILRDVRITAKAKGIFIYLLSLPDKWDVHLNELVTHFVEGMDALKSGLRELKDLGYVECKPQREKSGRIMVWDYYLDENPGVDEQLAENPLVANPELLSTNPILNTKKTIVATESQRHIIEHLNERLGKKPPKGFKVTNQRCLKDLNARLREYSEADIIAVIDNKCDDWMGTQWQKFLRPITLFNVNKFESYVNEIDVEGSQNEIGTLKELK